MEEYRVIGKDIPNDQAYGKVTGRLKYCSDYQSVGMLHMKLKPSTVNHGLIRAIHTEKAAAVPGVRATVAQFLGMHFSKVRVIKAPMGGSFGVRQETLLEPLTAYAAKDLEADVKLVYTREERKKWCRAWNAGQDRYRCGVGMAIKLSCEHLLEKAEEIAGAIFGCSVCLIRYENGEFFKETEPEQRISMRQVARHGIQVLGDDLNCAHTSLAKMNPAVPAAHFTQVEVDTYTGMVRIMHCLSVHDIGKAINPDLCRGQVGSGIRQGIGQALREEILIHPKTGETLTPNLKSYENMNAWDMPDYDVLFIEEPEESGPFNAKSIGEAVLPPVAPAVVAAVNDALGTELSHLPLTPAVILEALEANEA